VALSRPQVQCETQYLRTRQARKAYLRGVPGLSTAQEELSTAVRACVRSWIKPLHQGQVKSCTPQVFTSCPPRHSHSNNVCHTLLVEFMAC
jgi:hypothetical protein